MNWSETVPGIQTVQSGKVSVSLSCRRHFMDWGVGKGAGKEAVAEKDSSVESDSLTVMFSGVL
jgi:hypothetical protein